jgi:hypothetical protein
MDEACAWISVPTLPEEFSELDLVSKERARNVDFLGTDDDDSLTYMSAIVPLSNYLATYEASRPKRCPFPSTTTCLVNMRIINYGL